MILENVLTNPHCASYARDTPCNVLAFLTKSELIVHSCYLILLMVLKWGCDVRDEVSEEGEAFSRSLQRYGVTTFLQYRHL